MPIDIKEIEKFVENNISSFHDSRISSFSKLKLETILKRKNPYLFKAKNINTASDLVKLILQAFLSSQEETIFGEFLEKLAIFACQQSKGGFKSGIRGIDLEFEEDNIRYIVTIKSGPNWGNSSQIEKMKTNFLSAKKTIRTQNAKQHIIAVNGCCYGKERKADKGIYFKYCGQDFWTFITDDNDFYTKIVEPIGYKAKEKNEKFDKEYARVINRFTKDFIDSYCDVQGNIDWSLLVKFNSESN